MVVPPERIYQFDGLRGWAALCVILFHFIYETFGARFAALKNPFFGAVINGQMDVDIFFVISGAALSYPYLLKKEIDYIAKACVRRYFRLMIPIMCAALLLLIIDRLGLCFNQIAVIIVHKSQWPGLSRSTHFPIIDYVNFALNILFQGNRAASLMPFLWTMPIEFIGSMIVFCLLSVDYLVRKSVFKHNIWISFLPVL